MEGGVFIIGGWSADKGQSMSYSFFLSRGISWSPELLPEASINYSFVVIFEELDTSNAYSQRIYVI